MGQRANVTAINGARTPGLAGLHFLALITNCHRGQEICRLGHPSDHWYRLICGAARRYVVRPDGRRQIVDLLLPGDFFGFSSRAEYDYTVEAVGSGTIVAGYARRRVEMLADQDPQLARELRQVAFEAMSRLQAQLMTVGRITAVGKVGSFLVELADRQSEGSVDRITLPISRYDIADYLGLSVETVSRSMTDLKHRGVIALSGTRSVRIVDRDALTDGPCDEPHEQAWAGTRERPGNGPPHSGRNRAGEA